MNTLYQANRATWGLFTQTGTRCQWTACTPSGSWVSADRFTRLEAIDLIGDTAPDGVVWAGADLGDGPGVAFVHTKDSFAVAVWMAGFVSTALLLWVIGVRT